MVCGTSRLLAGCYPDSESGVLPRSRIRRGAVIAGQLLETLAWKGRFGVLAPLAANPCRQLVRAGKQGAAAWSCVDGGANSLARLCRCFDGKRVQQRRRQQQHPLDTVYSWTSGAKLPEQWPISCLFDQGSEHTQTAERNGTAARGLGPFFSAFSCPSFRSLVAALGWLSNRTRPD